jgi:mandelamide amidase
MTELTATAAVEAMRNGDMKAEDYARALLDRAQAVANLNAFRTLDRDMVLQAAQSADKARSAGRPLGMLHGLPIPVKDSVNTKDLPTSNGTRVLRDFKAKDDAAVLTGAVEGDLRNLPAFARKLRQRQRLKART